jgi:hypothetical protein
MDKKKYLEKLYDYLKENNHTIISEYNYGYYLKIVSLDDNNYITSKGEVLNQNYAKFNSKHDFSGYAIKDKYGIGSATSENFQENFFVKMFREAPKDEQRLLIKNVESYIGNLWRTKFLEIFSEILNTTKELNYLHSISISVWDIGKVPFKNLDKLISSKEINEKEIDDFYLKFFKARKNQIKDATWGPKVKKFLVQKYGNNEEKLKPYCDFSNYIREIFEEIDLDIIEPVEKFTVLSQINYKKATNLLCMPKYDEKEIVKLITNFVSLMAKHKGISRTDVEDVGVGVIEIRCYTNNAFTQAELNKEIKDYLLFKKKNIDIPLNAQTIEKYFMVKELKSELEENKSVTKKMKL